MDNRGRPDRRYARAVSGCDRCAGDSEHSAQRRVKVCVAPGERRVAGPLQEPDVATVAYRPGGKHRRRAARSNSVHPARLPSRRRTDVERAQLQAHEVGRSFTEAELVVEMEPRRLAEPASRSVLGVMNEFTYLTDVYAKLDGESDLLAFSMRLAETPCGPLYKRHISPDRQLAALVTSSA